MKEIVKMLTVLTLICAVCGLMLSVVQSTTAERIKEEVLVNVKAPALKSALSGATNDLVKDNKEITIDGKKMTVFIGKKNGKPFAFAFEVKGKGYGGDIGVMVGFSLESDVLTGIGITTHKETPGVGSRVTESAFTGNFSDKSVAEAFKIRGDKGVIDAVTGATISSRGVCGAVTESIKISKKVRTLLNIEQ